MPEIIQGDNGTVMQATISDHNKIVDIRGTTVEFTIYNGKSRIVKSGSVVDGMNGICEFVLSSEDVQEEGNYVFQATVRFPSGKSFSSNIERFKVGRKL